VFLVMGCYLEHASQVSCALSACRVLLHWKQRRVLLVTIVLLELRLLFLVLLELITLSLVKPPLAIARKLRLVNTVLPALLLRLVYAHLDITVQQALPPSTKLLVWLELIAQNIKEQFRVTVERARRAAIAPWLRLYLCFVREAIIVLRPLVNQASAYQERMVMWRACPHQVSVLHAMLATTVIHMRCKLQKECVILDSSVLPEGTP
jgi:hypothetical protein